MRKITSVIALILLAFTSSAQTPIGGKNTSVRSLGGFICDSSFNLPFVSPTKRFTKGGADTLRAMFVSTTDTLPKFMKNGVVLRQYTDADTANLVATKNFVFAQINQVVNDSSIKVIALGYGLKRVNDTVLLCDTGQMVTVSYAAENYLSITKSNDSFVKYSGSNKALNMGNNPITAKRVNTDTLESNTSAGLHLHNASHQDIFIAGAGGGQNFTIYAPTAFSLMANQSEEDTLAGFTSSGLVKKIGVSTYYFKKSDTSDKVATKADVNGRLNGTLAPAKIFVGNSLSVATAVSMSGHGTLNDTGALRLSATGVLAGQYGSATAVPKITVDSFGRITDVDSVTITGGGGGANVYAGEGLSKSGDTISFAAATVYTCSVSSHATTVSATDGAYQTITLTAGSTTDTISFSGFSTTAKAGCGKTNQRTIVVRQGATPNTGGVYLKGTNFAAMANSGRMPFTGTTASATALILYCYYDPVSGDVIVEYGSDYRKP